MANKKNENENTSVFPTGTEGRFFEIHVKGHLDDSWSDWLEGLEVKLLENGEMILSGYIGDQAALMGSLNKLYRLNLNLLSVNEIKKMKKKETKMENTGKSNSNFEAIAWGALFIWWGITELVKTLPAGTGLVGVGLIMLGLNVARYFNGIAISGFTTTLGILAFVWGGLELVGTALPFEIPVFAILVIVLGVIVLGGALKGSKNQ